MLGILGRGGMGVVYKAIQEKANRPVAIKMILSGVHASPTEQMRFRAEAEAAARLSHPHIVQLYEVGETSEGILFFSLEFVSGGTLAEHLKQGRLEPQAAAALLEALARAMGYAHERGIVHRDLKPANILLSGGGDQESGIRGQEAGSTADGTDPSSKEAGAMTITRAEDATPRSGAPPAPDCGLLTPKISDFGLAKQLDAEDGLTGTGAIVGTPAYMAPEQAFGESKNVGPAADTYALGAILYECLTGRPPFQGASIADMLEQVRTTEPVAVRAIVKEIHRDLETICLHCLRKDPQRRYPSAEALADDLRRYQEQKPILVRPVSRPERAYRWCRRNPAWAAMVGTVTVLALSLIAGLTYTNIETRALNTQIIDETNAKDVQRIEAEKRRKEADEKTVLAERRREQSLQAVGLFATDARMYCDDAMVPAESRQRLYEVLIKQLERQADEGTSEFTIDGLRNKLFLYQTICAVNNDFGRIGETKKNGSTKGWRA
jgi:serine/threonine protein kinase